MRYEGRVFRPPSEGRSLILQVTLGCSYNRCAFCAMYRDKTFRVRPPAEVEEDLAMARAELGGDVPRVFLADGDALILSQARLEALLFRIVRALPGVRRISAYATPQSLLRKSVEELEKLKALRLSTLYLGVESGSDAVLARMNKGVTADEMVEAGRRAVEAGVKLSCMIILGAGGPEGADEHARASAEVISRIDPRFLSTLNMMLYPGTPLQEAYQRGEFTPPTERQSLEEMRTLLAHINVTGAIFRSNHVSNVLPIGGTLMKDRDRLVALIDEALDGQ